MLIVGDPMRGILVRAIMIVVAMFVGFYKSQRVASGTLFELCAISDRVLAFWQLQGFVDLSINA